MLYLYELFSVVVFVLWVFCLADVITTPQGECRNLPKMVWFVVVLILMLAGSVLWLVAGRPRRTADASHRASAYERGAPELPEYDRPGRSASRNPETDTEFHRRLRDRAEEQRRKARGNDS